MPEKTYALRLTESEYATLVNALILAKFKSRDAIWDAKGRPDSEYAVLQGKEAEKMLPKLKALEKTVWNAQVEFKQEDQ